MISYDEPVPGFDERGNEVICNRTVSVTKEDAISIQRYVIREVAKSKWLEEFNVLDMHPNNLLADYVAIHCAINEEP
jgi:hypothetical protein